jgi:hypothetical protein
MRRRDSGNSRYWVSFVGVLASFLVVFRSLSVEDRFVLRVGRFPKGREHHYLEGS